MIIYNVTVKIDTAVHDQWMEWMKNNHIQKVLKTNCFTGYKMYRLLGQDESEGITYAIQYFCENPGKYQFYQENCAPALQKEHAEKYKDQFVAFRTLMQLV